MLNSQGSFDRVLELLQAGQHKQALALCDKALKKSKGNEKLLTQRIAILLNWPDPARHSLGLDELTSLHDKAPLERIENLVFLDTKVREAPQGKLSHLESALGRVWSRAASNRPKDEEIYIAWYGERLKGSDWRGAQQASVAWMKNFPQAHEPFFLYIVATHLLAESTNTKPGESQVLRALVHKNLSNAFSSSQEQNINSKPPRSIQSIDELLLMIRLYRAQGLSKEAFSIAESVLRGTIFDTVEHSWELARHFIEAAIQSEQWEELYTFCFNVLRDVQETAANPRYSSTYPWGLLGDDWKVWSGILTAIKHLASKMKTTAVEELIQSFCQKNRRTYNARLALLEFNLAHNSTDDLLNVCFEYYCDFSSNTACFQNLKSITIQLNLAEQEKLIALVSNRAQLQGARETSDDSEKVIWLTREINALKLEYYLVVSRNGNAECSSLVVEFIACCLRLYKLSLCLKTTLPASDRLPGDDAAILATMGLVRLYKMRSQNPAYSKSLFQAVVLLECLLLHSKHNYDALIILSRLYMSLGAGSLAIEHYFRLSIKHVQHTTLSWVIFNRVSTVHPHNSTVKRANGGGQFSNVHSQLIQAIRWHLEAVRLSCQQIQNMQREKQWNMLLDTIETKTCLENSFCLNLAYIESKRISRLFGSASEIGKVEFVNFTTQTNDLRDRSAFPNYEGGVLTFEDCLPQPATSIDINDKWLMTQFFMTRLWEMLQNNGQTSISERELEVMRDKCSLPGADEVFTCAEWTAIHLVLPLNELHKVYLEKSVEREQRVVSNFIREMFQVIRKNFEQASGALLSYIQHTQAQKSLFTGQLNILPWDYFHTIWVNIDVFKLTLAVCNHAAAESIRQGKQAFVEPKWLNQETSSFTSRCRELFKEVQDSAENHRRTLKENNAVERLHEAILGTTGDSDDSIMNEFRVLYDRATVVNICEGIRASWVDALDGIIEAKLS